MFARRMAVAITIGVVVAVASVCAFLVLLPMLYGTSSNEGVAHIDIDDELPPTPIAPSESDDIPIDMTVSNVEAEIDPQVACHDPLGDLSEECLRSLDAYFLDKPFVWREFDWLPVPMSYRRIFADPIGDSAKVLAALEKPECRLEEGEIRWDLRETCHAESIANYANLLKFCQGSPDVLEASSQGSPRLLEEENAARQAMYENYEVWIHRREYERHSRWAGERLLEMRWLTERACVQHDVRSLTRNDTSESKLFEALEPIGRKLELFSGEWDSPRIAAMLKQLTGDSRKPFWSDDAFNVLRALAARLGNRWAISVYESKATDGEWTAHYTETMPWKKYLEIMHIAMNYRRSTLEDISKRLTFRSKYTDVYQEISALGENYMKSDEEIRTSALAFAVGAWAELEAAGMEIDLDRLVEYVCGPNWLQAKSNCQEVIEELNETESSTEQRYWHLLARFEARAIELKLFDSEPSYRAPDWERRELGILELPYLEE